MHIFWTLALQIPTIVSASILERRSLRYGGGHVYANTTVPQFGNSTLAEVYITTSSKSNSIPPPGPGKVPTLLSFGPPIYTNTSSDIATCTGQVTYFGSVPPTVYLTIVEGFDVTVTASNASVTDSETLITPPPACDATIMPLAASLNPQFAPLSVGNLSYAPELSSMESSPAYVPPPGRPQPLVPPEKTAVQPDTVTSTARPQKSIVYSSVAYTSTVIVTRKTPVPVVVQSSTPVTVNFHSPPPVIPPTMGQGNRPPTNTGRAGNGDEGSGSDNSREYDNQESSSTSFQSMVKYPTPSNRPPVFTNGPPRSDFSGARNTLISVPAGFGLGNIINPLINPPPPPATASSTQLPVAPVTTTIRSVTILIFPSSVAIGSRTLAIPTAGSMTVDVRGTRFTVRPSEIVASGETVVIPQAQQSLIVTIPPQPSSTVVTAGAHLTFTVGNTVAIISSTTYRIGKGIPATSIVVDGTTVSLGPGGVTVPGTTFASTSLGSPYVTFTANDLSFFVDKTEAILRGTTYRIGSSALEVTTVIGGQTVSFGTGGIGLESTTIAPAATPATESAQKGSRATSTGVAATQSPSLDSKAGNSLPMFYQQVMTWATFAGGLIYLSF